ncbi:ATP-binding protein [Streptomyces sp. HPF1205]|uniref:ATP-binding protein n=1 Tax=Streptomyces sp. HPF1205 TaxID=2873262 RepID=UPI001CED2CD8|nr:ATP-binding protein [Streptomyces sp. HPF1205]
MGKHGAGSEQVPFGDAEDLKGFKSLAPELSPEVRDLASALRGLFKATGKSLRQFAVYHHLSAPSVSRYLAGERIPDKQFLDILMKSACKTHGLEVTAELQGHIYRRHREALLADQPLRYREQMASDRLEDAILQKEEAELQIRDLRADVRGQQRKLRELEVCIQQLEAAGERDRQRSGAELDLHRRQKADFEEQCARLRQTIEELKAALAQARRERDSARERCTALEAELAQLHEQEEREELQRQAREEQWRMAKAARLAEQHMADLDSAHQEAERVRLEAARDAAAEREKAEAQAKAILEDAVSRVRKVRPTVVRRSAALRQLRDAVQDMARRQVPDLAWRLPEAGVNDIHTALKPVGIHGRDDIGELAAAVNELHREVVRVIANQVQFRSMALNLSRRSQVLLHHQLSLLSALESRETDPDHLSSLYKLDHLSTRMRRNGDNLLALAGEQPVRRWISPVPLVDVLRAAAAEVEQYERIELFSVPSAEVTGRIVSDLVHLLAELLENATVFSAPHTKVRVTGQSVPDGRVLIEIQDTGLGLLSEQLAVVNQRLANPPTVDVDVSDCMGLFMVGRLSLRHGIRVQLRGENSGGTTALVTLPVDTLNGAGPASGSEQMSGGPPKP